MEHYSSAQLRGLCLKYEAGLAVLDLKGERLFRVPDSVTERSEIEIQILVLDENKLIELPVSINKLKNLILLNLKNNKLTNQPIGWFTYQYTEADQA